MSAKASGAAPSSAANGSAQHRTHHDGSAGRAYTTDQRDAVVRVRKCNPTAFYDILGLESERSTVTDAGIKKAYRKLSLLTHPDKNGCVGADEAFKMVSRAFQVLSDTDKKAKYDQFGGDPDSRFSGAGGGGASPFSGFARAASGAGGTGARRAGGAGGMFEEEISPEELFRQFFGGGGAFGGGGGGPFGGGLFDSGPGFVFGGPGGVRVHQFGGGRPRRRPPGTGDGQAQTPPTAASALLNLLPILLIFVLPILSSLLSGGSSSGSTWGTSSFKPPPFNIDTPSPPTLTTARISQALKVSYYHNAADTAHYDKAAWRRLDTTVENSLLRYLDRQCGAEEQARQELFQNAQGWFSVDQEMVSEARGMPMQACTRLQRLQRRQNMWF